MDQDLNRVVNSDKVVIVTTSTCYFCIRSKKIFKKANVKYTEIDASEKKELVKELMRKYSYEFVPMIFINGTFLGGCADLERYAQRGMLQNLSSSSTNTSKL